jgi:hypothetical protein
MVTMGVRFSQRGPVAQLGARLNGIQEVTSSILVRSTNSSLMNAGEGCCAGAAKPWRRALFAIRAGFGSASRLPFQVLSRDNRADARCRLLNPQSGSERPPANDLHRVPVCRHRELKRQHRSLRRYSRVLPLFRPTNPSVFRAIDVPMLLRSSNWSDSRQRLQSGLCLRFANSLPLAASAMVFEVCQIGVLRREQPVLLGLGLRP